MNIENLIFTLPAWQKTLVRNTEKENKKIANTESSLVYDAICLKENLLPTYKNIYIYIYIYTHKQAKRIKLYDNNSSEAFQLLLLN